MNSAIAQWVSVVTAAIVVAALVAITRMLVGKANKSDVDKEFSDLRGENKTQADESLKQYRELKTDVERLSDKIVALDKNSLTKTDLVEIKSDIKEVVKGMADTTKLIDSMPDRLVSLEATRNKQSER